MTGVSDLFGSVSEYIEKAEMTGKVDRDILEPLRAISSAFEEMAAYWLQTEAKGQLEDTFALYHVSRNCDLVLRRMIQRFEKSPDSNDNPRVADDASQVLPLLIDLYRVLDEAKSGPIDSSRIEGFGRTRDLRNIARMVDMLPSETEYLAAIPLETKNRGYDVFAQYIIAGAVHDDEGPC